MLKGKTEIVMNKSTMLAALQMYLDDTFKEEHVVTDVVVDFSSPGDASFKVTIDDGARAAKTS